MPGLNALGNALSFVPTLLRARYTVQKLLARLGWLAIAGLIVCGAMAPIAAAQGTTPSQSALQFTNSQTATFTCNVIGPRISGVPGPTGTVTITDLTDSQTLGTATLGTPSQPALFYYGTVNTGSTNATYGAVQIATGDFNGDGNQDIAAIVQDQFQSNLPDALAILLGNGDGTFQVSPPIVLSSGPVGGIVAADFNGDGKLDLAVATSTGVEIFLGNGDGTFESPGLITLPGILGQIVAGKFISTGNVDLAVANTANSFGDNPTIDVLLGNGDGTFQSPVAYPLTNFTSLLLATGDFRGNGTLDLAFVSSVGSDGTTTSSAVGVMLGNGDGTFQAPVTVAMPTAVYIDDFSLGNMTTSGHLDVVASGSGFSTVLLGNGDGTLQTPATIQYGPANGTTFYPGGSALLDLNGDGNLDLVVDGYSGDGAEGYWVLYGTGTGGFETPVLISVPDSGTLGPIVTADWNNDGYPSAAIADSIEGVDIFLGQRAAAQASVTNLSLSAGNSPTPSVVCAYSGDANYAASTSSTIIASFSTVTMPAVSPAPGTYLTPTSVTLTGFTSSASTYYTTDGSNPSSSSTLYTSPFALSGAETVKAISYLPGWIPSPVTSASYTLIAATPVLSLPTGTYASGATVTITDLPTNGSILYSTDGTTPSIPYTGPITVTSSVTIEAIATAPNMLNSGIASASYTIAPATATPVITPSSGGYMTAPSITITPAVAGTPIYYTLGGRTPTAASTLYTGPFTIPTTGEPTVTVKAVAIASGDAISPVASASYTNAKTNSVMTVSGSDPYALSCTVAGPALLGVAGPSGTVTFADTTTSQTLGTASLGTATQGLAFDPTYKLTGTQANVVAVGDFNGDGIPDLLEWGPNGFGGQAYAVQLGDGLGGFGSQITLPPPDVSPNYVTEGFLSAVVGDFNGDGKLDVAYFVESEDGTDDSSIYVTLNVAFGNGDGTFQAAGQSFAIGSVFIPDGYSPIFGTLVAGDFNGDGFTDVAIVGTSIAIFPGSSSGLVQSGSVNLPSLTTPAPQVLVGTFAGSNLDIVATTTNGIQVTESNGDGGFRPLATQTLTFTPNSIAAADFNGDGKLDLAVTGQTGNTGGIWILLGNGDGTFQNPSAPTISGNIGANTSLVTGDFNGDGIPDLASAVSPGEATAPITVALGNGNGTFQAPVAYPIGPYYSPQFPIVTADFNGDGRADLVSGQNVYISYTGTSAVASLTDVTITAGSYSEHALQCTYPGDANYSGSSNATFVSFSQAATPTFSLLVGNYSTAQTVTIADASGGPIYYTSDGTNPTTGSTLYTGPIAVTTTETLKAISSPAKYTTSAISEVVYTITDPPAFSVPGGTYSTQQNVSLSDGTTGAAIYYTTDGSTPGKTSTQYSTPITVVGNMTLNAVALAPGNLFSPVVSATYSVPPETTTTAIAASSLTAAENQKITLTATVTGMTPTGTVTFSAGTATLGTATLTSGAASLQVSFPNAGSYVITAAYSGNATNAASTSSSVTVVVAQGGTTTALASSTLTANEKQMITLTATVTGDNPTGTVAFTSGSLSLGTGTLTSGVATLQTSFATAGSYIITASYSGDTNNLASTSSTITVVVAAPSFTVASNPASQTISPGQSATFTFTVTPAGGYTGTVDFACGTLPSEATCSFNQSAVVITSGATGTSTLTISTAAPTTSRNEIPLGPWSSTSTLALAGIAGLAFAPGKMRRWNRTFRALLCIALLGALWLPLMGCGGGGGTTMVGGTPPGSYTVSVTASDSAGGATTSAQITLTVQ